MLDVTERSVFGIGYPDTSIFLRPVPITASAVVGSPAVAPAALLQAAGIGPGSSVTSPVVSASVTVSATPIAGASTAPVGVVLAASAVLTASAVASGSAVGTPVLAPGGVTLTAVAIAAASTAGVPGLLPVTTVIPTVVASTASTASPAVSARVSVTVPVITASTAISMPVLERVLRTVKRNTFEQVYTDRVPYSRYGIDTQKSILLKDGVLTVTDFPYQDEAEAADAFYQGGRFYALTPEQYQALVDAGGGDLVEIVT